MKDKNILSDALEYYDNNLERYNKFMSQVKFIKKIKSNNDLEHNVIIFYDKDKKVLLKSRYEIFGIYMNRINTWAWAWSIPFFKKNMTYISRKILNYGVELDPDNGFLKTELINSRYRITSPIQLDIHSAVASYLSKQLLVYKYSIFTENMQEFVMATQGDLIDVTYFKNRDPMYTYYLFLLDANGVSD
jgi:hypothetical protein